MATAKKNTTSRSKDITKAEVVEHDVSKTKSTDGQIVDGIYTEDNVKLSSGVELPIEVIVERDELPASFSSLVYEGNMEGALLAQLTVKTRRLLDLAGATRRDLNEAIAPVIARANELSD